MAGLLLVSAFQICSVSATVDFLPHHYWLSAGPATSRPHGSVQTVLAGEESKTPAQVSHHGWQPDERLLRKAGLVRGTKAVPPSRGPYWRSMSATSWVPPRPGGAEGDAERCDIAMPRGLFALVTDCWGLESGQQDSVISGNFAPLHIFLCHARSNRPPKEGGPRNPLSMPSVFALGSRLFVQSQACRPLMRLRNPCIRNPFIGKEAGCRGQCFGIGIRLGPWCPCQSW